MSVSRNKSTTKTSQTASATGALPSPQEFRQYLAQKARPVMRDFLEQIMREELDAFIGVGWGEHSAERRGYRNGYYHRDLGTTAGPLPDLKVPRDREGQFQTQVFENYHRYEPQVEQGLVEMYVAGVSTAKVGEVAETLLGVAPSPSAVSRLNRDLSQQLEEWRSQPLAAQWQIIYLDGVYFKVRHGQGAAVSMPVLVALAVDHSGLKQVLALRASAEESKPGWQLLLEDLRTRGVNEVGLFITDGNDGVLAALAETFPATPRQRCLAHIARTVCSAVSKGERGKLGSELSAIWQQSTKAGALEQLAAFKGRYHQKYPEAVKSLTSDEEHLLTFYQFERRWWRFMRTSNAIESLFNNLRTRTDSIEVFTTEESCVSLVWAALQEVKLHPLPIASTGSGDE